jgi:signal transduction histidine kinase
VAAGLLADFATAHLPSSDGSGADGVNAQSRDWRFVTAAVPLRANPNTLRWLAVTYPVLIAAGYLLKPSLTQPSALWPANAAPLIAYLLLRYRYWPAVMLVTAGWELVSVPLVSMLTGAEGTGVVTALELAGANIVSVVIPALLARLFQVVAADRQLSPLPSPLWLVVFLIGIVPGAILGTWVHAMAGGGTVNALDVTIWTLSTALGMVTFAPALAVALGLSREPAPAPAGRREAIGVAICIVIIFLWRGFVPWRDLEKVPSLSLLALPMTWVALRFSHRATALLSAALVSSVYLVGNYGFGALEPVRTFGAWQNGVITSQLFFLTMFGAALIVNRMTLAQRALIESIAVDRDRLRWYGKALDDADEAARRQTAADLHDGIAQVLTGQSLLLRALRNRLGPGADTELLDTLDHTTRAAAEHVRGLIQDLSPRELESAGLREVLSNLARQFEERYQFQLAVRVDDESRIPRLRYPLTYRVVRELAFNAFKHSGTARADVHVSAPDDSLAIVVTDEGVGFSAEAVGRREDGAGFGLTHLSECVQATGGTFEIAAGAVKGGRVIVRLPLETARPS